MAQLTLTDLTTQAQDFLPGKSSAKIMRAANLALRRLYDVAGPTQRFTLTTTAPYETGTVAITQGDTAVTLTTGTFVTAHTDQLIQMEGESSWYAFTRTAASTGTIASGFAGTTLTAGTFTIAYAFYDLPTTVSAVFNLWNGPRDRLRRMNDEEYDRFMDGPQSPGMPTSYALVRGTHASNSAIRIQLVPYPDAVYTFTGSARARPTLFTGSGTEYTGLPEDYDEALLAGTLYFLWDQEDKQDRSAWWKAFWETSLKQAQARQNEGFDGQYQEAWPGRTNGPWQHPVA